MRNLIPVLMLAMVGCGDVVSSRLDKLEVFRIESLPAYDGGRVVHPFRFDLDERQRFPQKPIGKATDAQCWMGDDSFDNCRLYECEMPSKACPSAAKCWDVAIKFEPDGSIEPYGPLGPSWSPAGDRYDVLHMPTCLVGGR